AWAPAGAVHEVASADDAELAVAEQVAAGASCIKIALNADAGPVWDDALLAEVVAEIRAAGPPVVAHVEGERQAERAIAAGVDVLAHTPFSEVLPEALVARAVAQRQRWVSTLAIHDAAQRAMATANVRAFRAAGGALLYGTDLGNGPQPLGVNPNELAALAEAGLDETAVLRALVGGFGRGRWKTRVTWMPARPTVVTDLADAVSLSVGDLEGAGA
ncbi:MAG: amidohydrolase, partial [Microbacteriaceae bacterium]|nr:amidohydrolase [Microbacteriaceae bacterium]